MTSISLLLLYWGLQEELDKESPTTTYTIYTNTSWSMPYNI